MHIILLSGGSGKRLWPLSNDIRSKQFIKIFKTADGYESMVQRVYRQITEVDRDATVYHRHQQGRRSAPSITNWGMRWASVWNPAAAIPSRPLPWPRRICMM